MAEGKNSFKFYVDWGAIFKALPDDGAGRLIKHIAAYVNDEAPDIELLSPIEKMAFIPIQNTLKRDLKAWLAICERNRINGAKGGRANASGRNQPEPTATERDPKNPVGADTDTDTDTDIDKKGYKKKRLAEIKISEVESEQALKIALAFQDLFKTNLQNLGISTAQIEKARGTWVDDARLMMENDKRTIEEIKEVFEFLKIDAFWSGNVLSIKTLRKQFEKLLIKSRNGNNKTSVKNRIDGINEAVDIFAGSFDE